MKSSVDLRKWRPYVVAVLSILIVTAFFLPFREFIRGKPGTLLFIDLIAVVLIASRYGIRAAIVASIASMLFLDLLFLGLDFGFSSIDFTDRALLTSFFIASFVVAKLSVRLRHINQYLDLEIVERKRAENLLAGQNQLLEMIATAAPLEDVLNKLILLIESQCHSMIGSILLLEDDGVHVRHGAAPHLPAAFIEAVNGASIGPQAGSCGTAMFDRKTVIVTDIMQDPLWKDYRDLASASGLRACWSTPILSSHGKILGSFAMYYLQVRSPSPDELRHADIGSHIAGIAIEHKEAEERIRLMAQYDALTGLPNRSLLQDRMRQAIANAHRNHSQVAILFIDLDDFKQINDSLGHHIGDRLLQMVAARLTDCLREDDSVARLGGDEFVLTLPFLSGSNHATLLALKVLNTLGHAFVIDAHELHVSASIGISLYPDNGMDVDTLMRTADIAMYHAKGRGRGNFHFFTAELNQAAQQRLGMESGLRRAFTHGEFVLHYQPQVDMESGAILSAEALLRWQQPGKAPISCGGFIATAEEIGLIVPIGEWALREACQQLKSWRDGGYPTLRMAVNLSSRQFDQPHLASKIKQIVDEAGIPASALELEITESILLKRSEANLVTLTALCDMGIQLSVDDFGTGFSSLTYLQRFPVHAIKIDQSFVRDIGTDPKDAALVTAIIAMARSLRLKVTAEGVETQQQAAFLSAHDCQVAQGFYYSQAVPAPAFSDLLKQAFCSIDRMTVAEGQHYEN